MVEARGGGLTSVRGAGGIFKRSIIGNAITLQWRRRIVEPYANFIERASGSILAAAGKWDAGEMVNIGGKYYTYHVSQKVVKRAYDGAPRPGMAGKYPSSGGVMPLGTAPDGKDHRMVLVPADRPNFFKWMWWGLTGRNRAPGGTLAQMGIDGPKGFRDWSRYWREWRYYSYSPSTDMPSSLSGFYFDGVGSTRGMSKEEAGNVLGKALTDAGGETASLQLIKEMITKRFRSNGVMAITGEMLDEALRMHTMYDDDLGGKGEWEGLGDYAEPYVKGKGTPGASLTESWPTRLKPIETPQKNIGEQLRNFRTDYDKKKLEFDKLADYISGREAVLKRRGVSDVDMKTELSAEYSKLSKSADELKASTEKTNKSVKEKTARVYWLEELSPVQIIRLYNYLYVKTSLSGSSFGHQDRQVYDKGEYVDQYVNDKWVGGQRDKHGVSEVDKYGLPGSGTLDAHGMPMHYRGRSQIFLNQGGVAGFGWQSLGQEVGGDPHMEFAFGRDFWPTFAPIYLSKARRLLSNLNSKNGKILNWCINDKRDLRSTISKYRQTLKNDAYLWMRKGILDHYDDIAYTAANTMGAPEEVMHMQLNLHNYSDHDAGEDWDAMRRSLHAFLLDLEQSVPQYVIEGYPGAGAYFVSKRLKKRYALIQKAASIVSQLRVEADEKKREEIKKNLEMQFKRHWLSKEETGVDPDSLTTELITLLERYPDLLKLWTMPSAHSGSPTKIGSIPVTTAADRTGSMPFR
jgi:hypothetical protein